METKVEKIHKAFRLNADLLDKLKKEAKKTNSSLDNYIESILMESVYYEPNETTLAAVEEARSGKFAGTIDTSSLEAFIKSCEE